MRPEGDHKTAGLTTLCVKCIYLVCSSFGALLKACSALADATAIYNEYSAVPLGSSSLCYPIACYTLDRSRTSVCKQYRHGSLTIFQMKPPSNFCFGPWSSAGISSPDNSSAFLHWFFSGMCSSSP